MHRGLGHQSEPPPRPVWEWWCYPACWAYIAAMLGCGALAAWLSLWWLVPLAALVGLAAFVIWLCQDDIHPRRR